LSSHPDEINEQSLLALAILAATTGISLGALDAAKIDEITGLKGKLGGRRLSGHLPAR
jgi:hypothetical protein